MKTSNEVYILSAARTPIGAFLGSLKDKKAPQLGAIAIQKALEKSQVPSQLVDETILGIVLSGGVGQAPARQATLFANLPNSVRCTSINRVCGSGVKSVMLATQAIRCEDAEVVVAGGMESMSNAPYVLDRMREGYRLGPSKMMDSMILDGLWDPYNNVHMGDCGELCAKEYKITREDQDRYAKQSYERALHAIKGGSFKEEIVPVTIQTPKQTTQVSEDEEPARAKLDQFGTLRPAFLKDGTITAANASSLSDGAAALVLASSKVAKQHSPMARVVAQASHAQDPKWFTTAPVGAIKKVVEKAGMKLSDIDLFEINEAFSVVALACLKDLGLSEEKVNVRGGAVALGHPIGASGARILTTLLYTLKQERKKYGIACLCIGGGEGSAILVENLHV